MIHIYCGDGKGKTTASIGLAVRMAGYGRKVLFEQFLKGSYTGELEILGAADCITVMRCDRDYGFFPSMTAKDRESIMKVHNANLCFALENKERFDMIVLDEIFDALSLGLADAETVMRLASEYRGELVMTGREPDERFLDIADYVSEIKKVKHPYDNGTLARKGVEF